MWSNIMKLSKQEISDKITWVHKQMPELDQDYIGVGACDYQTIKRVRDYK